MSTARGYHTASLLPDGRVVVAGGYGQSGILTSAEVYDPAVGSWITTGPIAIGRESHTASVLANGRVLIAGGVLDTYFGTATAVAELYDVGNGGWTTIAPLALARSCHTATMLRNGEVLVAGGWNLTYLPDVELYNPGRNVWSASNPMITPRGLHTANMLPDGKVVVMGGGDWGNHGPVASVETYDPIAGTWSSANPLNSARFKHTATALPNGQVLVAGGVGLMTSAILSTAELWGSIVETPSTPVLISGAAVPGGNFGLTFTNVPGLRFTVLATEDLQLSGSAWQSLGLAAEVSPGRYQFIDPGAPNTRQRFYRLRWP